MAFERRKSKEVRIGNLTIGGNSSIAVQSMLNIPAHDIEGSVRQAKALEKAGCQIIRAAIPDMDAVKLIPALKEAVKVPIVADIHFDYRLALESISAGVDKIRINPGNIGSKDRVKAVADACANNGIPIRVGVNSGSIEKDILAKYGAPTAQALVDSAMGHVRLLEECDFNNIVISLKSSDVPMTVEAYELISQICDYPLHVGITEAGTWKMSLVKSSVGIGSLLLHGIGDTIRVSMTDDPVKEVAAGYDILRATGAKKRLRPDSFVPDLRQNKDRFDIPRKRSRRAARVVQQADKGRGHGLCRQRTRRSERSRYRYRWRRRLRADIQKGSNNQKST